MHSYLKLIALIFTIEHAQAELMQFKGKNLLAGFSGLHYAKDSGSLYVITDRGPVAKQNDFDYDGKKDRTYLTPSFIPKILQLKLNGQELDLINKHEIYFGHTKANGLPTPRSKALTPFTKNGVKLHKTGIGIDPESICIDKQGMFWVGEEYGPSLLKLNSQGKVLKRYQTELGQIVKLAHANRGFESIACHNHLVYLLLQGPTKDQKDKLAHQSHLFVFDTQNEKLLYSKPYPLSAQADRIGAMTYFEHTLLVLEQNGKKGEESFKALYQVETRKTGLKKSLLRKLNSKEFRQYAKVEGMAILNDGDLLFVIDNDFKLDPKTKTSTTHFIRMKL